MDEGLGRVKNSYLGVGTSTLGLGEHGLCLSSQQGLFCSREAPARKLAESEHSISVPFGRATFHKLWLSAVLGDDLWINREPYTPGKTEEAGKKTGTHFSGGFGAEKGWVQSI